MNITQEIDDIITQRKRRLPIVRNKRQQIEKIKECVQRLELICQEANSGGDKYGELFKQYPEVQERLRLINTKEFNDAYIKISEILKKLEIRFSREEIHLSFVGRAGQGKSLVMHNISGLSGSVIPSADGADCTGAKSIITNRNEDGVSAEIRFYTQSEYLEIVNRYLHEIFDSDKFKVTSIEDILNLSILELERALDTSSAKKQSLYVQLKKYIEHSTELRSFLGTTKIVPEEEIERYVAQYSSSNKEKKYFLYLGVKVANILCRFPYSECGKIVLVDTIGLGATALDLKKQMLETVGNDSDVILLMTRPDGQRPHVEQDDIDIINDIRDMVTAEYTRNMLFWIINKVSNGVGRNIDGISEVEEQINRMPDFPIAKKLVVDCKEKKAVETELLIPILETLTDNLPKMEEVLLKNAEKYLNDLYKSYHRLAEQISLAFVSSIDQDIRREFSARIDEKIKKMTNSIRELYISDPYGRLRNQPCEKLKKAAEEKLNKILTRVPEEGEVLMLLNDGTINQHNAYEVLTDRIRLDTIDDFLELNEILDAMTLEMKQYIAHCLADKELGNLNALVSVSSQEAESWLSEFLVLMEENENYKCIGQAIKKLDDFKLKMESFLIYRIRAHLDVIDISLMPQAPSLRGGLAEKEALASDIIFWLEHNLQIAYREIKKELEPLYTYPNSALWAVVKDFYDRVVYSRNLQNGNDVKREWRYLYEDSISVIWKKEYEEYQAKRGISEGWNALINEIRKYDNVKMYDFTNEEVQ